MRQLPALEFAFEAQNLYEEDVHIADVRTSCGCTTPTITSSAAAAMRTLRPTSRMTPD